MVEEASALEHVCHTLALPVGLLTMGWSLSTASVWEPWQEQEWSVPPGIRLAMHGLPHLWLVLLPSLNRLDAVPLCCTRLEYMLQVWRSREAAFAH